jgi:dipeptidase E
MAERTQRILAIGGVQLYPGSTDWPLHQFMLDLTGRERPRICMLATAMGESPSGLANFYATFARSAEATHLDLFGRTVDDIEGFLLDQDVVYVGGGHTANMLAIWRLHGVDKALKSAWEEGVLLAGWSAGANCWFDGSVTDSFGPNLDPLKDGLRFLPGSFCPHYDSEANRRPLYQEFVGSGILAAGFAADDGVGLVFRDRVFLEAVSFLPGASAWRVEPSGHGPGGGAFETRIPARLLS